ncbi:MAG: cation transporter [Spirulinaceae cyanobacterium SM2_1_0]|nr:cation transporter [Spirulinaceae cyanobacterium SM2_1_0]
MPADHRRQVHKVLLVTLALNLVVLVLKATLGWLTGSLSLQADALHSVTDSANNILGLVANRFSQPEPDRQHPYGHQKFEALGALGIAAFLAIACFEILQHALERLLTETTPVTIALPELALLLVVLAINIFVAVYERRVGERVQSPILLADARHTLSDIWVTTTVLGGLAGIWLGNQLAWPQLQWLDVVLALPVSALVFYSGWEVLRENVPWLVDEVAIAPERIHTIVIAVPGVLNCHNIASRGVVGRQVFIEMHLIVAARDVESAHDVTEAVEQRLEEKFGPARISIHVEPPDYQSDHISVGE